MPATPTLHESVGSLAFGGELPVHEYPDVVPVHPVTVESAMHVPGVLPSAQQYSVSSVPATPMLHESVGSLAVGGELPVHEYPDAVPVHPLTVESAMQVPGVLPSAQQYSVSSVPATPTLHESVESIAFGGELSVHEYPDAVPVHPVTVESAMHVVVVGVPQLVHESTGGVLLNAQPMTSSAAMIEPATARSDSRGDSTAKKRSKTRFIPPPSTGRLERCLEKERWGRFPARDGAGIATVDSELCAATLSRGRRRSLDQALVTLSEWSREDGQPLAYSTDEAPGAVRNGARVRNAVFAVGDTHAVGDLATVVGSVLRPAHPARYGYFVVWDDMPDTPVFITGDRVAPL